MCDNGLDVEWAWFAGFFDGEGCVRVNELKRKSNAKNGGPVRYQITLVLHIVQVDRAPLDRVLKIAGTGHVRPRKKWKNFKPEWQDSYEWVAGGSLQIRSVLENLRRFTILKTPQLDAALALLDTYGTRGCRGNQRLDESTIQLRKSMVAQIKSLKRTRICDLKMH